MSAEPSARGKVRDIYDLGDRVVLVATDRISAFDVVLPSAIPHKGRVLTQLSRFWFDKTADIVKNHLLTTNHDDVVAALREAGVAIAVPDGRHTRVEGSEESLADEARAAIAALDTEVWLEGRASLCRKAQVLPIECIVRGYLAGSGWSEYAKTGTVCAVRLPEGLVESDRLPGPIFTPSTKTAQGHDINVDFETMARTVGAEMAIRVRDASLALYSFAHDYALERGIIIADTKFEFGLISGELTLVDEALTPDSSRFWPADAYEPGHSQPSFDKQFVRDWLDASGWDRESPPPVLPDEVVAKTGKKYVDAYERLTGENFFADTS